MRRRVAAAAILLLVGGCATGPRPQPIEGESARRDALQALASWTLRGRVAVAAGSDGFSGGLQWQQLGPNAEVSLYGPLGGEALRIKVDGADYARVDASFNDESTLHTDVGGWINGDFDYNNKVDGADYALIDAAFNSQSGTVNRMLSFLDGTDRDRSTMTGKSLQEALLHFELFGDNYAAMVLQNIPEPACLGLSAAALLGMRHRRRRSIV